MVLVDHLFEGGFHLDFILEDIDYKLITKELHLFYFNLVDNCYESKGSRVVNKYLHLLLITQFPRQPAIFFL